MMEQDSGDNTVQDQVPAPDEAASLGKMLREARERLGLSVADVAGQTKLAVRQIEALEAEDYQHLPEMPFVRGFVRSYAKILQLDAQPLLACLPQPGADPVSLVPASVEAPFPSPYSPQRQNLIWLGAALLLSVLVVAFAVWHFTTPQVKQEPMQAVAPSLPPAKKQEAVPPPAPANEEPEALPEEKAVPQVEVAPLPVMQEAPPARAAASAPAMIRLAFDAESWVEVRDGDGNPLSSQINPPGSELRLDGKAPFTLIIGHAASVRLYYRGKRIDLTPHISAANEVARLTLE